MRTFTCICAAALAFFVAAPAEAGGINPMLIGGPMMHMMQQRPAPRPEYRPEYRPEFRPAPRPFIRPPMAYGRRFYGGGGEIGGGVPGGYGGANGYGGGGFSSHVYMHREWYHHEWYHHVEVHHAAPVIVAPPQQVIVERPAPRVIIERSQPRVIVEHHRRVWHHPVHRHYVARGCGCNCCSCCNCGHVAAADPPGDPPAVDASDDPPSSRLTEQQMDLVKSIYK